MNEFDKLLRPVRRVPAALFALFALSLLVTFAALREIDLLMEETSQFESQAERMRAAPAPKPRLGRAEEERNEEWSKLALERGFNWYPVFVTLEKASSDDIELLEFRPDKVNGQLSLRGEARNLPGLVDYLERLADQPLIARVYLSHQKTASRDALQIVTFEIQATIRARHSPEKFTKK